MSNIEVKEVQVEHAAEIAVGPPKAAGWMAFCRPAAGGTWMQVYEQHPAPPRDFHRCPYPLFQTREAAIQAGQAQLPSGGELRLAFIQL